MGIYKNLIDASQNMVKIVSYQKHHKTFKFYKELYYKSIKFYDDLSKI
jgi:hypothetical protein